MTPATLPTEQPALRVLATPADANYAGDIHGGWLLAQADIAGAVPTSRKARGLIATVSVNSFNFTAPVFIGDLVSFFARVSRIGRSSITAEIDVYAERNPNFEDCVRVAQASITYVAVGADRRPRAIE